MQRLKVPDVFEDLQTGPCTFNLEGRAAGHDVQETVGMKWGRDLFFALSVRALPGGDEQLWEDSLQSQYSQLWPWNDHSERRMDQCYPSCSPFPFTIPRVKRVKCSGSQGLALDLHALRTMLWAWLCQHVDWNHVALAHLFVC